MPDKLDPASIKATAPDKAQAQFLEDCRDAFLDMCAAAEISEEMFNEGDATEVCDRVIRWWAGQPDGERPPFDAAASILGVAAGDLLLSAFPTMKWMYLAGPAGGALGLFHAKPRVVVAPLDAMMTHLEESPEDPTGELLDALANHIDRGLKGLPPETEGDED